jgi:hypothetical protein
LIQGDGFKLLVDHGFTFKVWRRVTDQSCVDRNVSSVRFLQRRRFSVVVY